MSEQVETDDFRQAMACFPSGVTIVTTEVGTRWGFTASSFTALSLEPPLVLVCLDRRAECHPAFTTAPTFAISVVAAGQEGVARAFATKGADKFGGSDFVPGPVTGAPTLAGAAAVLECRAVARHPGGDHMILVGEVVSARSETADPVVYHGRSFWTLSPAANAS